MERDVRLSRGGIAAALLGVAIAAAPESAAARTSQRCLPVYNHCVADEQCRDLAAGSPERIACFQLCGEKEAECRSADSAPIDLTAPALQDAAPQDATSTAATPSD
jgi:hypothetical protein